MQSLDSSCHNPQSKAVKYKEQDMKTVSIKTLTALLLFVFLLGLRFKLYRDRQYSLVLNKVKKDHTEHLLETNKTSSEEEKVSKSN